MVGVKYCPSCRLFSFWKHFRRNSLSFDNATYKHTQPKMQKLKGGWGAGGQTVETSAVEHTIRCGIQH